MKTPFDIISVLLFGVIAILFLHRSAARRKDLVSAAWYAVAAGMCAVGNVVGNRGGVLLGAGLLVAGLAISGGIYIIGRQSYDDAGH